MGTKPDAVDIIVDQWDKQRPDLDVSGMTVIGRLSRIAKILDRRLADNFALYKLQAWEFDVLATLRRAGPPFCLTPGALVKATMVTSGAITNRIDRLVSRGLVYRSTDPDNRRSVLISLAPLGLGMIDEAVEAHVEFENQLLEGINGKQKMQLVELLRALLLTLE
jgi:DNA-binding MarR family transcriptional regulator